MELQTFVIIWLSSSVLSLIFIGPSCNLKEMGANAIISLMGPVAFLVIGYCLIKEIVGVKQSH